MKHNMLIFLPSNNRQVARRIKSGDPGGKTK